MFRRTSASLLLTTALVAGGTVAAQAGGFATRQHSVTAQGESYAGIGTDGPGLSGMFWNPAVVTSMPGRNSDWNLFGIIPDTRLSDLVIFNNHPNPLANASINSQIGGRGVGTEYGTSLLSTGSYNNLQLNENVFIGLSINAPYGSGTNLGGQWAGNWDVVRTRISAINAQPVLGYRFNEQFSIAVGAQIQYITLTQEQTISPLGALNQAVGRLSGDDYGFGFTVGATWKPLVGTQLGIGYRSAIDHRISGDQYLQITPQPLPGCVLGFPCSQPISANITLPELVTFGIRQQITPELAISGSVEWQNWSRVQTIGIQGSPTGASLPLNYRDGWFAAIGADYRVLPNLTVRAGIGYEWTPVRDFWRTVSIPDSNRLWLSSGVTYDVNSQLALSAAYTYIRLDDERVRRPTNANGTVGTTIPVLGFNTTIGYEATVSSNIHIIGVSARYRWDAPVAAVEPVIARF